MMKSLIRLVLLLALSSAATTAIAADVVGPEQAERTRLRRHFAGVQQSMTAHTPAGLDEAALDNRRALIAELGRYADRGIFPRNSRHPNQRRPYFIDDEGRACAVGHLMISSGYESAARDIAARQNNAYVHDIRSDAMGPWLALHGITQQEAALIQPGYCGCPDEEVPVCGDDGTSYLNDCVATRCAGVVVASCGACDPNDSLTNFALSSNETLDAYCEENGCSCPEVGGPFVPPQNDDGGCAVHAPRPLSRDLSGWAVLLGLVFSAGIFFRRRRRTGHDSR